MKNILSVDSVAFTYHKGSDREEALKDISFNVLEGEIFGFIGPNGAGKTTTIKLILGLAKPERGNISVMGKSALDYTCRRTLGYMPEVAYFTPHLTPRELLLYYASIFDMTADNSSRRIEELLDLVGLSERSDSLMKGFSKGMMQKVSFAQALINDPDILVLDEPTGGLDPLARANMRNILSDLRDRGKTVFFSSHELSEVELITDRIALISAGRIISCGKTEEIVSEKGENRSLEKYFLDMMERQG